jgi:DNA-binding Lrp family transcriptional regulator
MILSNEMVKVDVKDRKILYHLYDNSRQSLNNIGKKVGLSKELVRYRINRLQNEGVIQQYIARINNAALGYGAVRFYYSLQFATPEIKKEIIDFFVQNKQTVGVIEFEGKYDLQVGIFSKFPDFSGKIISFYDEIQNKYRDYLDEQIGTALIYIEMFDCCFLLDEKDRKPKPLYVLTKPLINVDDFDIEILRLLISDSKKSTVDIARKLNSTVATIKTRMDKLKKGNIIRNFSIIIDWEKIGYRSYIVEINLKNYSKKYEIIQYVRNNPNLWFIMGSIGHNIDLEFEFVLESITRLHDIIKDLSTKFPESIKNFQYFTLKKIHKFGAIPEI